MIDVKSILREAWSEFISSYQDGQKCEDEFSQGRKRTGKEYAFSPWNEEDVQFSLARKISELYAKVGLTAEIHHQWNIVKWYEVSAEFLRTVKEAFPPRGRQFDLWISQPYAALSDRPKFDVIMEIKMYREGRQDFYPWRTLKHQIETLIQAKSIDVAEQVAVALINRRGLSKREWNDLITRTRAYKDLIVLEFNTRD